MKLQVTNLLTPPAAELNEEYFETLLQRPGIRVERIVSSGQSTPAGEWYDQPWDEWVLLLTGEAAMQIEGESEARRLLPGDCMLLPSHCRHRVTWTAPDEQTVWLALHFTDLSGEK